MKRALLILALAPAASTVGSTACATTVEDRQDERLRDLVRRGREKLDDGDLDTALALFSQADAETKGKLWTRMWVLRTWMAQGHINDAFDEVDKFTHRGIEHPDLDYLYGMGSYFRAMKLLAQNTPNTTAFAFGDTVDYLTPATEADPAKYYDAFIPLAEAAWYGGDLELAETSARTAVEREPENPYAAWTLGRVLFSRFAVANAAGDRTDEAAVLLAETRTSFERAAELIEEPQDASVFLARIHKQLGDVHLWREDHGSAGAAYAEAMGWEPIAVDYATLWDQFSTAEAGELFIRSLESGAKKYAERHGDEEVGDSTLLWWIGYARFVAESYEASEAAFKAAVEKWPEYVNSWYYVGLTRYYREDYDGAIEAWQQNWELDPANLVTSFQTDREVNLDILTYVLDVFVKRTNGEDGREADTSYTLKSLLACRIRAGMFPENPVYLDNLGLFLRDAGDYLRSTGEEEDAAQAVVLFEEAFASYREAYRLAPNKPHLVNDAAVILHYYLERDYDTAMKMYEAARDQARALLDTGGLSEIDREDAVKALDDSTKNIVALEEKLDGGGER